jgi:molecular chaperone GrpE
MEKKEDKPKKEEKKEHKKEDDSKKKLEEKNKKIAELTDTLQHLQAEMENMKKRCEKDMGEARKFASTFIVEKLLPILDSFELALKNTEKKEDFIKGVELIYSQMFDMLEKEGLRKIDTANQKFDPYKHEVLMTEKADKEEEDDLIIEELQKGYMFKDKVMRYAKVKIKKK